MDASNWRIKVQPATTGSRKFHAWSQIVVLRCWLLFVISSNIPAHKYTQTNDHVPLSHSRLTRLVATLEKQESTASAAVQICHRELHNQLLYVKWMLKMLFQELEVPHLEKGTPSSELISPCAEWVTPDVQGLLANPLLYPLVEEEGVWRHPFLWRAALRVTPTCTNKQNHMVLQSGTGNGILTCMIG